MKSSTKTALWLIGIMMGILILLLVLVLTLDISWWWFFGFLFLFILAGIVIGLYLVLAGKKKPMFPKTRAHPKNAIEAIRQKIRFDEDNPDEIIILEEKMPTEGQPGTEKTEEFYVKFLRYWDNLIGHAYIDMNSLDRIQLAYEASGADLKEMQRSFALNPTIEETEEETYTNPATGKVERSVVRKKQTLAQKKEEKEKKEVEAKEAL